MRLLWRSVHSLNHYVLHTVPSRRFSNCYFCCKDVQKGLYSFLIKNVNQHSWKTPIIWSYKYGTAPPAQNWHYRKIRDTITLASFNPCAASVIQLPGPTKVCDNRLVCLRCLSSIQRPFKAPVMPQDSDTGGPALAGGHLKYGVSFAAFY